MKDMTLEDLEREWQQIKLQIGHDDTKAVGHE